MLSNKRRKDKGNVRVEKVLVKSKTPAPKPKSNGHYLTPSSGKPSSSPRLSPKPKAARPKSASPYPSSSDERRKRKAASNTPRESPMPHFSSDSDSDADEDPFRKRRKLVNDLRDPKRKLRHGEAFGNETIEPQIIPAAEIASIKKGCKPFFTTSNDEDLTVELQYPSRCRGERYELVTQKDNIETVGDIIRVVRHVADWYLTEAQAQPLVDSNKGIIRQLERTSNKKILDLKGFKSAVTSFNGQLLSLVKDGSIAKNLDQTHTVPSTLVDFILTQVYDRTVSPHAEDLNKYRTGSDNVYGELRYPFVRKMLLDHGKLTSDKVFVDLGSGVGNVVLQAALEIGCRSYGCEMVERSCDFAEAQQKEFRSRCQLWGLAPGKVVLERGDFRTNRRILDVLKEADLVLVNNKAFTPSLNEDLVNMFLDLKIGCKIISLKNFVHGNEKAAVNDAANNILKVEEDTYGEDWVSWTNSGDKYFVSTRKVMHQHSGIS